jgi:hypothetical protein
VNPQNSQLVRDIREPLFDTYTIAKNTAMPLRIVLFGDTAKSGVGSTKPEQTNLTKVGELPNPEHHDVYSVIVEFLGMLAAGIIGISKSYVLKVKVSGRELLTTPITPTEEPKTVATIASDIILNARFKIDLPEDYKIEIQHGAPFSAELVGSTAYTPVDTNGQGAHIRVKLDGVHTAGNGSGTAKRNPGKICHQARIRKTRRTRARARAAAREELMDRINPRVYPQFRGPYHTRALAALEPLRKALGYEPRNEVIPDQQHVAVAKQATWDHRVTVPPGSWLWALSGSSQQPEGFTVQVTDFATRANLFSGAVRYQNLTGQGSVSINDAAGAVHTLTTPLHILPTPRPLIEPAVLNVQITNLSTTNSNEVQLVLWILEPPAPNTERNEWNAELEREIERWRRVAGGLETALAASSGAPSATTAAAASASPMLAPAYHRPFDIDAAGDNIVVPGVPGMQLVIHQVTLYNTLQQDIRFLDGPGGQDLMGALPAFGEGGGLYLPYQSEPHFVLSDGQAFVINLTALASIGATGRATGFVKYRLFKQWTPGSNA